ncbi:molybdopterin molybdotransferase MoeA [Algoriphagus confluentis]|uniref:Molybdopterin molybdenumtransferase n=1 Tax=Algoriphagus confluentis TaxID=1697556 RepID=A0ABQ6PJY8_9BACT|nr:molybdopterin molybdotransferase MoeA [Algoriphagus confluentis]
MISVSEAKSILQKLNLPNRAVSLPISLAIGHFLAQSLSSKIDVPSFDNSAMDGYAFAWEEGIDRLEVMGEAAAGSSDLPKIEKGQAVRIFTGAPLPAGADSVIMQEKVKRVGDFIQFKPEDATQGNHVRYRGTQCRQGEVVAEAGAKITPGLVSLLASVGVNEVLVSLAPKVAIIITGNEIQELGKPLEPGQIYNANGPALESWLKNLGISEIQQIKVQDQKEAVVEALSQTLEEYDLVIFTGGISVGDYDFVKIAVEENGVRQLFYKLKQRPGKPLYAGEKEGKIVFALPGNPGSVLSCFLQYVKPVIQSWKRDPEAWNYFKNLPLSQDFEKKIPLTQFLKARIQNGKVQVLQGQESFNLIAFGLADGFVEILEESSYVEAGRLVRFYPW